ncbi:phosphotriesterase family protein [Priestia flexa]|uniref:phosphotriesterase family protein n=1 Tax=Priestia flexa TaxID=86664 RepID=UPI003D2F3560
MIAPYIQTVRGAVNPKRIIHVQPHEHLMLEKGYTAEQNKDLCIDNVELSSQEIQKLPVGSAIVDAQPLGAGRMAKELVEISKQTGMHVIACTGFHKSSFYWPDHWIHTVKGSKLADMFITELQSGMYVGNSSDVPAKTISAKAGLIKTAVGSNGITNDNIEMFEAAVEASLQTQVSIMVHIEIGSDPFQVIQFFTNRKIPANKLILCHLDRTHHDEVLHQEIASTGVYLEYDTIGRFKYHDDNKEIHLIKQILESGYENAILLSLDTTRARLGTYGGEIGIDYLLRHFIPKMKAAGINNQTIQQLTRINPIQALSIKS